MKYALGYYELSINGAKVGDRVLDPATTYYHNDQTLPLRSRVLYATYDVTGRLSPAPMRWASCSARAGIAVTTARRRQ